MTCGAPAEPAERALGYAQRACALEEESKGENLYAYLDSLAKAQHQTGDTAAAVETQKRAMSLLPSGAPEREELAQRLAEYEAALSAASIAGEQQVADD